MDCAGRWLMLGIWLLCAAAGCSALDKDPAAAPTSPAPMATPFPDLPSAVRGAETSTQTSNSENQASRLPPAQPADSDIPMPINLPTALRLANAQPLVIAAAQ